MKCSNCKKEVPESAKACGFCGTKIEQKVKNICPECGKELPAKAKVCGFCGTPLQQKTSAAAKPIPVKKVPEIEATLRNINLPKLALPVGLVVVALAIVVFFVMKPALPSETAVDKSHQESAVESGTEGQKNVDLGDGEKIIEEQEATEGEEKGGSVDIYFEQDGFWLFFDPQLVLDVQPFSETIPAVVEDGPNMVSHPEIIHFDLAMEQAHVYITEVDAYDEAADFASESFRLLSMLIYDPGRLSDCVPELPLDVFYRTCDRQQFAANLKKVDFANGSGVRFITIHGIHDFAPVDNEHLVYIFQGFTDHGNLFVKIYVRLLHDQLPDTGTIPSEVYSGDLEAVESYFSNIENMLNTSENDFSPQLDWIDNFLASLRVVQPG